MALDLFLQPTQGEEKGGEREREANSKVMFCKSLTGLSLRRLMYIPLYITDCDFSLPSPPPLSKQPLLLNPNEPGTIQRIETISSGGGVFSNARWIIIDLAGGQLGGVERILSSDHKLLAGLGCI